MTVTAAAGRMWGLSPEAPAAALRQQSSHSQPGDGSHRCCLPVMDEGINLSRMHLISLKKSRKVHTQQLAVQLLYCLCRAHSASGNSHRGQDTRDSQSPRKSPGLWGLDPGAACLAQEQRHRGTTAKCCRVLIQPSTHRLGFLAGYIHAHRLRQMRHRLSSCSWHRVSAAPDRPSWPVTRWHCLSQPVLRAGLV